MLEVVCSGTPYEIGLQHGRGAKDRIAGTIAFYNFLFAESARLDWAGVTQAAAKFESVIASKWPDFHAELRGVADGSGSPLLDIVAINVRTEITYGLAAPSQDAVDGCTAMSWRTPSNESWLAQNWDWREKQRPNLILLHIRGRPSKPDIRMVTEAGLIGKIGLNSAGVGACLNAISARGADPQRIPCHLGLRLALECTSVPEAVEKLREVGVASACHFLLADAEHGGVGMEWSSVDAAELQQDEKGRIFHANHYNKPHAVKEFLIFKDSPVRLKRIEQLADGLVSGGGGKEPDEKGILGIFEDRRGAPGSICRDEIPPETTAATLFNIIMELGQRRAWVTMGKPTEPEERFELSFES